MLQEPGPSALLPLAIGALHQSGHTGDRTRPTVFNDK
eukprot:gene14697-21805_t